MQIISITTRAWSRNNPDYEIAFRTDGLDPASLRRRLDGDL